jgi:hypothetical protein
MHVANCVFAFNDAGNTGGALAPGGNSPCLIENSTFFDNHAGNTGGAICGGPAGGRLLNDTIYGNSCGNVGGGVDSISRSTALSIQSSVIAGNTDTDLHGSSHAVTVLNSLIGSQFGNNLANGSGGNIVGNGTSIGLFPISNLLGPLQLNGGPTETMVLLNFGALTNPAIDAGSNVDNLEFDQRGAPFARTIGAGTDIGAYEAVPEPSTLALLTLGGVIAFAAKRR